jgi:hypothetical protein
MEVHKVYYTRGMEQRKYMHRTVITHQLRLRALSTKLSSHIQRFNHHGWMKSPMFPFKNIQTPVPLPALLAVSTCDSSSKKLSDSLHRLQRVSLRLRVTCPKDQSPST